MCSLELQYVLKKTFLAILTSTTEGLPERSKVLCSCYGVLFVLLFCSRRHAMNQVAELCKFTFPNSTSPSTGYISFKFRVVNRSSSRNEFSISSTRVETAGASYQGRSKVSRACRNYLVSFRFQYKQALGLTVWPHREWQPVRYTSHRRLNGQLVQASFDDEFRSSQSVALGLHRRYKSVVDGGFTENLREFIDAGVTAYAVGCTDEGLRKELLNVGVSAADVEGSTRSSSKVGLKSKLTAEEVEECMLWTSIIFITILCTPQRTIVRWSSTPAVSAEAQVQWRGFCALIANAYYVRGMAWLPVKTLQMEQMAVAGYAEEPSLVADRMRLVFATLEAVSPQWPVR